jgi:NADPH-dependent 2,4-dienoyl-CoA reductase/sulfur reductase-like enzyme
MLGKQIDIVEVSPTVTGPRVQGMVTRIELEDRGVNLHYNTGAERITDEGLHCATPDGPLFLPADTVVIATGVKPLWDEAVALGSVSPVFHMVGDCAGGKLIKHATESAHTIATLIGRYL